MRNKAIARAIKTQKEILYQCLDDLEDSAIATCNDDAFIDAFEADLYRCRSLYNKLIKHCNKLIDTNRGAYGTDS